MMGLSWLANIFPHMVTVVLLSFCGDYSDMCTPQDFQGQRLAEQLFQYIILLFGVSHIPRCMAQVNCVVCRSWALFGDTYVNSFHRLSMYLVQALCWLAWYVIIYRTCITCSSVCC